jgi:hypothetical protein
MLILLMYFFSNWISKKLRVFKPSILSNVCVASTSYKPFFFKFKFIKSIYSSTNL